LRGFSTAVAPPVADAKEVGDEDEDEDEVEDEDEDHDEQQADVEH
jgi:hypothetical protein